MGSLSIVKLPVRRLPILWIGRRGVKRVKTPTQERAAQIDKSYALMGKRARIHGSTLRARPLEEKAATARALERSVLPLVEAGAVKVPIAATYPLQEAPAAYDAFSSLHVPIHFSVPVS